MALIIKGMEMPKSCESCKFCWRGVSTGTFCKINSKMLSEGFASFDSRDTNCPLVELPPHGNLKDEKAIEKTIVEYMGLDSIADLRPAERSIFNCIGYAPTILEASEVEHD